MKHLKNILKELVHEMENTVPYAAALATEVAGERITVQTKQQSADPIDPERGIVFTVFTGRHFMESSTHDLGHDSLRRTAQELVHWAEKEGIDPHGPYIDPGENRGQVYTVPCRTDPAEIPLAEKVEACQTYVDRLHSFDSRIVNALCQYSFIRNREFFVNRHKTLFQDLKRTQAVAMIVMRDGERSARLHTGRCRQGGYEHFRISNDEITRLVADCGKILMADRLTPGTYDCIFSPEFAGIFAHEAFGHGTETDMFLKKRAKGEEYMNQQVASPLVDMFDSPARKGEAASFLFDHEGQVRTATRIIEQGILRSGLTDLNSATRLNLERTANGRRESFEHKAYARMTNTYFGPGKNKLKDMIRDIRFGFLLDHPSNGMEDPKGWGIQLEGYYAEKIRDGRLTGKVYTPVIVTGYVPELLQSITMVGDDVKISGLGMCGKGHKEWIKVTDGGPYLRLKARLA
ncbi:MAG: TldD/PmbA family protein [Pseudomonadota bacterium]